MAYFEKNKIDKIVNILKKHGFEKTYDKKNSNKLEYSKHRLKIYFDWNNAYVIFPNSYERKDFKESFLKPIIFISEYYHEHYLFMKKHLILKEIHNDFLSNFNERLESLTEPYRHYHTRKKAMKIISDYNNFLKNWNE